MKLITELHQIESDYKDGSIEIAPGLTFSQYQTLRMVDYYSSSKYLESADTKDRPFYNIVNTMVDTAVVATDIDTKDIRVEAERPQDYDASFLYNHEIQKWMKEDNFAQTLNQIGETRPRYGGVLVKRTEEKGKLNIDVVQWKNAVVDPVDIEGGVIVEKHYLTPKELLDKKDVWENIDEAIELYANKGYTSTSQRIEVWEVSGVFPESYLSEDAEYDMDTEYSYQKHFFAVNGEKNAHLFWKEDKPCYKYLPWKPVSGRSLGRGVVEEGEESQVWTNDAIQKEQAAMELASRIILKTNSKKIGNNVMTDHDNGSIIPLEENKYVDVMQLLPSGLPAEFQNLVNKWWSQYERSTSSYDAVRGETPPSGQPYRLQALVANQGGSHFDYRREELGILLTEIFNDWVFPYVGKRLTKKHILAADFSPEELERIDEQYSTYNANREVADKIFDMDVVTAEEYNTIQEQFREFVGQTGKRRFMDIPDGYYKDMKAKLTINVTGEQKNKMAMMESLSSMLQTLIPLSQQGVVSPEDIKMFLNKILELSGAGVSPLSLNKANVQSQQGAVQGAVPSPVQKEQEQLTTKPQ